MKKIVILNMIALVALVVLCSRSVAVSNFAVEVGVFTAIGSPRWFTVPGTFGLGVSGSNLVTLAGLGIVLGCSIYAATAISWVNDDESQETEG